jgi:hypothetical protein
MDKRLAGHQKQDRVMGEEEHQKQDRVMGEEEHPRFRRESISNSPVFQPSACT